MEHVNYPHWPGYLFDCPACEERCHCEPNSTECVWSGHDTDNDDEVSARAVDFERVNNHV